MTNSLKPNPTLDLDNLHALVQEFRKLHNPLDHATVREERACERCRILKAANKSLTNLHEHRKHVTEKLEALLS